MPTLAFPERHCRSEGAPPAIENRESKGTAIAGKTVGTGRRATSRTCRAGVRSGRPSEARPSMLAESSMGGSENAPHSDVGDGGRRSQAAASYSSTASARRSDPAVPTVQHDHHAAATFFLFLPVIPTIFCAASQRSVATSTLRPDSTRSFRPSSALVP